MPLIYRKAIVLGTMLVPTTGHLALIEFASNIASSTQVLIQGRSFEPVAIEDRVEAIKADTAHMFRVRVQGWNNDDAPQNPDPTRETSPGRDIKFWKHWRDEILSVTDVGPNDVVVASEHYGAVLADYLGCHFVPFDIDRTLYPTKGTWVRRDLFQRWDEITPSFRKNLKVNLVMFGQESVGKTTLAQDMTTSFS